MNSLLKNRYEHRIWIAVLIIITFTVTGCQPKEATKNAAWEPVIQEVNGVDMAKVPPGCFIMGDSDLEKAQPAHEVCITEAFWIDVTEVSNGQFEIFGGQASQGSAFPGHDISSSELPRTSITWDEAAAFCQLRGGSLPTEAQWEYAARGPEAWTYPWGDNFEPTRLNFCDQNCPFSGSNTGEYTSTDDGYIIAAPVKSYQNGVSWVGALNMSGNVAEWVNDYFDPIYYKNSPRDNPTGPESGQTKVVKSSPWSWWTDPELYSKSANRLNFIPDATRKNFSGTTGFRCVRSDS